MSNKIKFSWVIEELIEFICGLFNHDIIEEKTKRFNFLGDVIGTLVALLLVVLILYALWYTGK